jgi:hypothetical protein
MHRRQRRLVRVPRMPRRRRRRRTKRQGPTRTRRTRPVRRRNRRPTRIPVAPTTEVTGAPTKTQPMRLASRLNEKPTRTPPTVEARDPSRHQRLRPPHLALPPAEPGTGPERRRRSHIPKAAGSCRHVRVASSIDTAGQYGPARVSQVHPRAVEQALIAWSSPSTTTRSGRGALHRKFATRTAVMSGLAPRPVRVVAPERATRNDIPSERERLLCRSVVMRPVRQDSPPVAAPRASAGYRRSITSRRPRRPRCATDGDGRTRRGTGSARSR